MSDAKPATLEEVFERFLGPVSGWPSGLCNTIADMLGDKDARIAELVEKAKGQTHFCPECEERERRIAALEAENKRLNQLIDDTIKGPNAPYGGV